MKCVGSGLPAVEDRCPVCLQELPQTRYGEYPTHWNPYVDKSTDGTDADRAA